MHRTRVKICGVCHVEDALLAARAGADAVGIVLHPPSPRNVPLEVAERIVAALPPFVTPVGVFVDAPAAQVNEVSRRLRLRHVQLNGHEGPGDLAGIDAVVIKALRVERGTFQAELDRWREASAARGLRNLLGFVLETAGTAAPGGTGVENDWETVALAQRRGWFEGLPAVIAAGGLRPEAVADVVRSVRPWAVDVSSGVEVDGQRGRKSARKVHAFIDAVKEADAAPVPPAPSPGGPEGGPEEGEGDLRL